MFGKYRMSLNRVHDTVEIREGGETLTLRVSADPMRLVAGLTQAQKLLQAIDADSTEEQRNRAAGHFAEAIFGAEQAGQLFDFYRGDASCVINICGKYFAERLRKLIEKAQKRVK